MTWFRLWLCSLCFALAGPSAHAVNEYQLKAVFLLHFAQFVAWPEAAFDDGQAPLIIGVLGEDPFGSSLEEAVSGETVNRRPLVVRHYRYVDEIKACHILFISRSESERLEQVFSALRGRPILTVGDSEAFATRGGMIRFSSENSKTRFRINLSSANEAHLVISSKLLRMADIVDPGRK